MKKRLRVLLAEDSAADAELVEHEIRTAYEPMIARVENAAAMSRALDQNTWDIVISDYYMPGFGALAALKVLRDSGQNLPFIIVSGNMGEEFAVEAMRAGADDYVTKRNLSRLVPAIDRELRDAEARAAAQRAEHRLLEHQAILEGLVSHFPGVVFQLVWQPGTGYRFLHVSRGSIELLELPPSRIEGDSGAFFRLLLDSDAEALNTHMQQSVEQLLPVNWEGRLRAAESGLTKWVNMRLRPRRLADGAVAWEGFMANITKSKENEIEMLESRRRMRELTRHLENVKEHERTRIARELHDDVGGNLTAIKIDVLWLAQRLGAAEPKVREKLAELESLVDQTAASITRIGQDLRPSILDLGLVAAIEWQAADFSKRTGVASGVKVKCEGPLELDHQTEMALFSIFRETLTNIAKHARATHVKISLECTNGEVELSVVDNGRGIAAADRLKPTSFGLRGMEERAAQLGGAVTTKPGHPRGTVVAVRVPRRATVEATGLESA